MNELKPDFKTISNFRKNNKKSCKLIFNKRLEIVKGEFALTCLAYKLKRILNILGFDKMIASMKSFFDKKAKKLALFLVYFNLFIRKMINILYYHSKLESLCY